MRKLNLTIALLLIFSYCLAQEKSVSRNSFLSAGYRQIKEDANFGLVFKGPEVNYGMTWNILKNRSLIIYEFELGLGIPFSREIPSLAFYLKPVDLACTFRIMEENNFFIGPSLAVEYNYNLYPDLQSGFDYWFTNFSLGARAIYDFNYKSSAFRIMINTSLFGLTSRQDDYRDPYFYDIGFNYAVKHLNQKLNFGSIKSFNSVNFELLWKAKPDSRFMFGYQFKYSGYYNAPEISMISNSIKLTIGKKQK
jgi:hypothetical protein